MRPAVMPLLVVAVLAGSCEHKTFVCAGVGGSVLIAPQADTIAMGDVLTLRATAYGSTCGSPERSPAHVSWSVMNPSVLGLLEPTDSSLKVVGLRAGAASVRADSYTDPGSLGYANVWVITGPPQDLGFAAAARVDTGVVSASFAMTNRGSTSINPVIVTICSPALRLYRTAARTGTPAWDQATWYAARPGGCKATWYPNALAAGETATFRTVARVADILGDTLATGHYYAAVLMGVNNGAPEAVAGEVELAR